jgi:hypothetical protein
VRGYALLLRLQKSKFPFRTLHSAGQRDWRAVAPWARHPCYAGVKSGAPKNASLLRRNQKIFSLQIQLFRLLINADYRIDFLVKNRKHIMLNIG